MSNGCHNARVGKLFISLVELTVLVRVGAIYYNGGPNKLEGGGSRCTQRIFAFVERHMHVQLI